MIVTFTIVVQIAEDWYLHGVKVDKSIIDQKEKHELFDYYKAKLGISPESVNPFVKYPEKMSLKMK